MLLKSSIVARGAKKARALAGLLGLVAHALSFPVATAGISIETAKFGTNVVPGSLNSHPGHAGSEVDHRSARRARRDRSPQRLLGDFKDTR